MMKQLSFKSVFAIAFLLMFCFSVQAQEVAGKVIMARGDVQAINTSGESRKLKRRDSIFTNEIIKTGDSSKVQIRFIDNALLALKANSELNIKSYIFNQTESGDNQVLLELVAGGFRTLTGQIGKGNKAAYKVDTPVASIGIRGTLYDVQLAVNKIYAGVWKGGISLNTPQGQFDLGFGANFDFAEVGSNGSFTGLLTPPSVFTPPQGHRESSNEDSNGKKDAPVQGEWQEGKAEDKPLAHHGETPQPNIAGNKAPNPFEKEEAPAPTNQDELAGLPFVEQNSNDDPNNPDEPTNPNEPDDPNTPDEPEPPIVNDTNSPDLRLTEAEWDQLTGNSSKIGLIITDSDSNAVVSLTDDAGNPFFISANSEDSSIEVIRQGEAPDVQALAQLQPWSEQISWGAWNGNNETPIERYQEFNNNVDFTPLNERLFYIAANPATSAELNSGLVAGTFSTSSADLTASGATDFIAASNIAGERVIDIDAGFDLNLVEGIASISNAHINVFVDSSNDMSADKIWNMNADAGLVEGSLINIDNLTGEINYTDQETSAVSASGNLNGMLLSPTSSNIDTFAGGFHLQAVDGQAIDGIVILQTGQ